MGHAWANGDAVGASCDRAQQDVQLTPDHVGIAHEQTGDRPLRPEG